MNKSNWIAELLAIEERVRVIRKAMEASGEPEQDDFIAEPLSEVGGNRQSPPEPSFPRDPLAKSMADMVTPKQLGLIRALAREAEVDAEEVCQAQLRCMTEELSKRAASSLIDHLKTLQPSERRARA